MAKRAGEREANQGTIGSYIHMQADRPVIGVMVELACETDFVAKNPDFRQVANDIAMHISWGKPRWIRRDEVDPVELDKEKEIIAAQAQEEGKPENIIPKIVEGTDQGLLRGQRSLRPEVRSNREVRRHRRGLRQRPRRPDGREHLRPEDGDAWRSANSGPAGPPQADR